LVTDWIKVLVKEWDNCIFTLVLSEALIRNIEW